MQVDSIFVGATPAPLRKYLYHVAAKQLENHSTFIMPCAGMFTCAAVAIDAGYKPENVWASDITMFSSLVGYHIAGRNLDELEIEIVDSDLRKSLGRYLGTERHVGALLYAMKWCQIGGKNEYEMQFVDDLRSRRGHHITTLQESVDGLRERLKEMRYDIADMWDVIEDALPRKDSFLYVNPPGYSGGYTKMFSFDDQITWLDPHIGEFDPKDGHVQLHGKINDHAGFAMRLMNLPEPPLPEEWADAAVFAEAGGKGRVRYYLVNRPDECKKVVRVQKETDVKPAAWPVFPEEGVVITAESEIKFVKVAEGVALYYRDLFAHKMGSTRSESYYLGLIDGYIFCTVGIHRRNVLQLGSNYLHETYGFSPFNPYYATLCKLFMMCINCADFEAQIRSDMKELGTREVKGLATTCITPYPELKINRGVMKLVSREKRPDGRYHLKYEQDWHEFGYRGALHWWLTRDKLWGGKPPWYDGEIEWPAEPDVHGRPNG